MAKIELDKYYTPLETAKYCIEKTFEIIGKENITDIIEPSAGNGSFSNQMLCEAYDILPEGDNIMEQDYLTLNKEYLKGRLIIGNPPFGVKMNMVQKFFKKSILIGDYIAFILPISQHNNNSTLFDFTLVYSEDLGTLDFSDRRLHCAFNIYKRPVNGLNKKINNTLKDIKIVRQDSKGYDIIDDFDIRLCYWGNGHGGKLLKPEDKKCAGEYKIKILNDSLKKEIINFFETIDWKMELKYIAMIRIKQYELINTLRKYIPEIS